MRRLFILLFILLLSACTQTTNNKEFLDVFSKEGIKLKELKDEGSFNISAGNETVYSFSDGRLYIFNFSNESSKEKGMEELNQKLAMADMAVPPKFIQTSNSILLVLLSNQEKELEDKISSAFKKIEETDDNTK